MGRSDRLADQFESHRNHLRAVAYRMLGSLPEAEDAVQEAWLRLSRSDSTGVENLGGWLTTVVARVCLDMLRARKSRREESLEVDLPQIKAELPRWADPEAEVLMADSVGVALLVVLDTLSPAERLAFVLHDIFGLSFDEIGSIVGRTTVAAKKLASRARIRIQGGSRIDHQKLRGQRTVAEAFLSASRSGDINALLAVLDPDVVRRADRNALPPSAEMEIHGADNVVRETVTNAGLAQHARIAIVDGAIGLIVVLRHQLRVALNFTIKSDRITAINVIADPAKLRAIKLADLA